MPAAPTFPRTPLVIAAGGLTVGPVQATFRDGDRESLLHNYLVLVRRMRGQQREPSITLRNADISALAEHLGASPEVVLDDLLDRMGATRAQRKALLAMFAVGALSIVATGSVALELAPDGAFADGSSDAPSMVEVNATVEPIVVTHDVPVVDSAPAVGEAVPAQVVSEASVPQPAPSVLVDGEDWAYTVSLHQLAHALSTQPPPQVADTTTAEGVGVADDGSTVAVARPPAPPAEGVGVADDGSTVAVARPPAPPTEGVGVADDGSVVAVAPPPVP